MTKKQFLPFISLGKAVPSLQVKILSRKARTLSPLELKEPPKQKMPLCS